MKIHIVRKGDTLWEIAKQYGVDFEELKQFNSHLASPDMIMPGMKIRIPTTAKSVKKESVSVKETQMKPIAKEVPKQSPIIKEDDHKKPKEVKLEMPKTVSPKMPAKQIAPIKEVPKKEVPKMMEMPKTPVMPLKEMVKMPVMEEKPSQTLPKAPEPEKKKEVKVAAEQAPIHHYYYHCCCPPPPQHCYSVMGDMNGGWMPHPAEHMPVQHMPLQQQHMMQPHHCGCHAPTPPFPHYQMGEQPVAPMPAENMDAFGYQPYMGGLQNQPNYYDPIHNSNELPHLAEKPFPVLPQNHTTADFNHHGNNQRKQTNEDESTND